MAEPWPRDLWLDAIWEDDSLKPNERVVAYAYARYAGREDTSWTTWDEILRRTGMTSRRSVSRAVRTLTDAGWLTVVERARQHRSTVYRLTVPAQRLLIATAEPNHREPRTNSDESPAVAICTPAVAIRPPSGTNMATQYSDKSSNKNSEVASRGGNSLRELAGVPPSTKTRRSARTIVEATVRRQAAVARKIIIDETGEDEDTVDGFLVWLHKSRAPRDVVAYVNYLRSAKGGSALNALMAEYQNEETA